MFITFNSICDELTLDFAQPFFKYLAQNKIPNIVLPFNENLQEDPKNVGFSYNLALINKSLKENKVVICPHGHHSQIVLESFDNSEESLLEDYKITQKTLIPHKNIAFYIHSSESALTKEAQIYINRGLNMKQKQLQDKYIPQGKDKKEGEVFRGNAGAVTAHMALEIAFLEGSNIKDRMFTAIKILNEKLEHLYQNPHPVLHPLHKIENTQDIFDHVDPIIKELYNKENN